MLATIPSATLIGVDGCRVDVEVHITQGLPSFTLVGQPDSACREARDRARAAIVSSEERWPLKRCTVNLAPTGLRKNGAGLDVAIAIGVLVADKQLPPELVDNTGFVGELGLDGSLRPVPGTLSLVDALDTPIVVVPPDSAVEAQLVGRHEVRTAGNLAELLDCLEGTRPWPEVPRCRQDVPLEPEPDLRDVRGQPMARFALEVAAAGGHHILMVGPPGAGKTLLAHRLPGLLPELDAATALVATRIHSAAGMALPATGLIRRPPLRAPHHGASPVALIGGGTSRLQPGEISLSHGGVLFLDELGEFPAMVLDSMRQPLEEGVIRLSRADIKVTLPARFQLIAAMNPCPCGLRDAPDSCRCSDLQLARYSRRVSGPLLDRFDLRIDVLRPDASHLLSTAGNEETTAVVAARVERARLFAEQRGVRCNADLPSAQLDEVAALVPEASRMLERRIREGRLTGRGLQRVRRVARTVADLRGDEGPLSVEHIASAMALRSEPSFAVARMAG